MVIVYKVIILNIIVIITLVDFWISVFEALNKTFSYRRGGVGKHQKLWIILGG